MERNEILSEVKRIVADNIGMDAKDIEKVDTLGRDLGCNDLDIQFIEIDLEKEFGVDVHLDEISQYESVGELTIDDVTDYIGEQINDCNE